MFIHTVFFWLRPDLPPADRRAFEAGVASLRGVAGVRQAWWGRPAATNRPVIDRTYSCGLTLAFEDQAGHDAYQEDPIHLSFVEQNRDKWTRVQIYDYET
jgi:hypothetical protein